MFVCSLEGCGFSFFSDEGSRCSWFLAKTFCIRANCNYPISELRYSDSTLFKGFRRLVAIAAKKYLLGLLAALAGIGIAFKKQEWLKFGAKRAPLFAIYNYGECYLLISYQAQCAWRTVFGGYYHNHVIHCS